MADKTTIDTYNKSAAELAEKFRGIGSRVEDIEKGINLAGSHEATKVVEIGCGDGRDAKEIVKRVSSYVGIDPSVGLLKLARKNVPEAQFIESDALGFVYPSRVDVIYAFASLLHSPQEDVRQICIKVHESLRYGGIFYISLKERAI